MKTKNKENNLNKKLANSIECRKAGLIAKRINPYPPSFNQILKKLVYEYKLQRGARAKIFEELNPKRHILDPQSMLDIGDQIQGKILKCITSNVISKPQVGSFSGKHRANYSYAKGYVFCQIYKGFS